MKYLIDVVLDEFKWDGYMPEEGEDVLYDKYVEWINSKESGQMIDDIIAYLKGWDEDVIVDGGSLAHPNGIEFEVQCIFSEEIENIVKEIIEDKMMTFRKSNAFKNCPIKEIDFTVRVEEF